MKKLVILSLMALLAAPAIFAQDMLYLRNKMVKEVQIVEIGINEIKYKNYPPRLDEPVISIEKSKIEKLVMEDGETMTFSADNFTDADLYAHQKKNAIKASFSAPLYNAFIISYERSLKPGQSFEVDLGLVGLGFAVGDDEMKRDPSGLFVRGGYKFIRTPDFYVAGMKYAHILKGAYIKPELALSLYSENDFGEYVYDPNTGIATLKPGEREQYSGFAVMLNFGKQNVYSDQFLVDYFVGIGYGFTSGDSGVRYGFVGGGELPLVFSAGLKIGLLFNDKK